MTMSNVKALIDKGLKYYGHVEGYENSKLLSESILINMAGMSGEYLLGGLCCKLELVAEHGDILSYLNLLKKEIGVPDDVLVSSRRISKVTNLCCSHNGNSSTNMATLANDLKILKDWVLTNCSDL